MRQLTRQIVLVLLSISITGVAVAQTLGLDILLAKARSLEGRGRMDLAAENWRRVLLVDPNKAEALAGLGRFAKQNGNAEEANDFVKRLRRLNPRDPAIADIEEMRSLTPRQYARLDEAGRFAMSGKADDAMRIYHEVFGQEPPPGKWVEVFYKTDASATGGKEDAVFHLRKFCMRYPQNEVYRLWLAEVLTWSQPTRIEGLRLLQSIESPGTAEQAQTAWRQALLWEKDNPNVQFSLTDYLERYPDDSELQTILVHLRETGLNAGLNPNEARAYRALHADDLVTAGLLFDQEMRRSPNDVAAISGLGYVRQKQQQFPEALDFFERARALAPQRKDLREASDNAKFWGLMQQAAAELVQNRPAVAINLYRAAVALRPTEKAAVLGCGHALVQLGDFSAAEKLYDSLPGDDPHVVDGWYELLKAQVQANDPGAALTLRLPSAVEQRLATRPEYHAEMALACFSADQPAAKCNGMLGLAMNIAKNTDNEEALSARLQLAGTLMEKAHPTQALDIYQRAVISYPERVEPWEGLLGAYSRLHNTVGAAATLRSIPLITYTALLKQTGFLNVVAAIYTDEGACQPAETMLKRSLALDQNAGHLPALATKIQLAGLWLRAGIYEPAQQTYREVIAQDPNIADAWSGYIAALHGLRVNKTALAESKRMPSTVDARLTQDPDYLAILAAVQAELGNKEEAIQYLEKARKAYSLRGQVPPADLEIQLAWALLDLPAREQELRSLLTHLSARADLTVKQLDALHSVWSASAVRRAEIALQNNDAQRSVVILQEAASRLPGDPKIPAELGLVYLKIGDYQKAVDVYASWGMSGAEAGDYRAAAGAAMAAHNDSFANRFLQQGLLQWPQDPKLLHMAGEQAAAQGEYEKAENYLKSALEVAHAVVANPQTNSPEPPAKFENRETNQHEMSAASPSTMAANTGSNVTASTSVPSSPLHSELQKGSSIATGTFATPYVLASGSVAGCRDLKPVQPAFALVERGATTSAKLEDAMDDNEEEKVRDERDSIRNRNAPMVSAENTFTSRTGSLGFDRLLSEDAALGSSHAILNRVRLQADVHAVSLYSGKSDGRSYLALGTLPNGTAFGEQSAFGISTRAQLSTNHFGLFLGNSPNGFLVSNVVGGVRYNPHGGAFTMTFFRDSVRETMLSYAGVRDPASGTVWGGVISNAITANVKRGGELRGQYASVGFAKINGEHVAGNSRLDGNAGAYWRVFKRNHGALTLGGNLSALHYDKNLRYFTLGQGGYFSPQRYVLLTAPLVWSGRYEHLGFEASASLGVQHFSEDNSPFYPTSNQANLGTQPFYNAQSRTGPNYNVAFRMNWKMSVHWYAGAFATANDARDYAAQSVGLSLHYLVRKVTADTTLRTSSIPDWRGIHPLSIE